MSDVLFVLSTNRATQRQTHAGIGTTRHNACKMFVDNWIELET